MRIFIALFVIAFTQLSAASGKPSGKEWRELEMKFFSTCVYEGKEGVKKVIEKAKEGGYKEELMRAKMEDGSTCLHLIMDSPKVEVIKYLLEEGCDPLVINNLGESPYHLAIVYQCYCNLRAIEDYVINREMNSRR